MEFKEFIKKNLMDYFIIVTGVTVAIAVLGMNYDPDAVLGYDVLFSPLIIGAVSVLPSVVLFSRRELPMRQMLIRRVLHFIVLEITLLAFGNASSLFRDNKAAIPFAVSVFIIYLFTNIVSFFIDSRTADEINRGLKKLQN